MTDVTVRRELPDFATADIPALRRALLADAYRNSERAREYYQPGDTQDETRLAAWSGLLLAASGGEMTAALLGLLGDPRVPADLSERGRHLVGQVLEGWPEVLEGANDGLGVEPAPAAQAPNQQEIPAPCGFRVGDRVEITGRGDIFDGKTGVVAKVDADPEVPVGVRVEGLGGLVWCNSSEIRHAGAAESGAER